MSEVPLYAGGVILLLGAIFCLLASLGLVRLPDLLSRMHAASKAGTVGAGLVLLALAIVSSDLLVALRCIAGISFLLLTNPVSAHLLARSANLVGISARPRDVVNISAEAANEHR